MDGESHPGRGLRTAGNVSVLKVQRLPDVVAYKLSLNPVKKTLPSGVNCSEHHLEGIVEETAIRFEARWHTDLPPACSYKPKINYLNECHEKIGDSYIALHKLRYQEQKPLEKREETNHMKHAVILLAVTLILMVLLFAIRQITQRRLSSVRERVVAQEERQKDKEPRHGCQSSFLLVYSPELRPRMLHLAATLRDQTGCEIEDLYDTQDQDKLANPTAWLTQRLLDHTVRLVLAPGNAQHPDPVTGLPQAPDTQSVTHEAEFSENVSLPKGSPGKERRDVNCEGSGNGLEDTGMGGVSLHFLLKKVFNHLRTTTLGNDYSRVYQIRFEDQPEDAFLKDVTHNRLYQLSTHLPDLVHALTSSDCSMATCKQSLLTQVLMHERNST